MAASIQELIKAAERGQFEPVHVLVGSEQLLIGRAEQALRSAAIGDGFAEMNEDIFNGRQLNAEAVINAARTLPMMASARVVLIREGEAMSAATQSALAEYLLDPSPTTCLILCAEKLDGRSKLIKTAKKKGYFCEAKPLRAPALRSFAQSEFQARGHQIDRDALDALIDAIGNDLTALDDAIERLSLFNAGKPKISLAAVDACITHVQSESIWKLVDSIGLKDRRSALSALGSLLENREPALRVLAMIARQLRMIAGVRDALAAGNSKADAAKQSGVPPFKADELARAAKRFEPSAIGKAFAAISRADRELKGSKCPDASVLQQVVLELC